MTSPTPEELRTKARRHREAGRERMACIYDRQADDAERLAAIHAREITTTIRVGGASFRANLNHNDAGEWYGNAHGRTDVLPAAFVSGHASREECLQALRDHLKGS